MSAKRDDGRQRRANQNRAAREALAARRQAAAKRPETPAQPEAVTPARRGRGRSRAQSEPVVTRRTAARAAGQKPSAEERPTSSGRSRVTRAPVPDDLPPAAGFLARTQQVTGGRQMLAGFVLAVTGSIAASILPVVALKSPAKGKVKAKTHLVTLVHHYGASSLVFLLIPIAFAVIPLLYLNHPRRRRAWNIAALLMGSWILFAQGLGVFYLFAAGSIVWGVMKLSRAEGPAPSLFSRFSRRPGAAATDADRDPDGAVDVDGSEVTTDKVPD